MCWQQFNHKQKYENACKNEKRKSKMSAKSVQPQRHAPLKTEMPYEFQSQIQGTNFADLATKKIS